MELINGLMEENTLENGKITRCTEMVSLHGVMEENMKVDMWMTRSLDMVNLSGQMVKNMLEIGLTENNTVLVYIIITKENKKKENGKTEKESNG